MTRRALLSTLIVLAAGGAHAECGFTSWMKVTGLGLTGCDAVFEYSSVQVNAPTVTVTKPVDQASSALMFASAKGQPISKVTFMPAGGQGVDFINVTVTSFGEKVNGDTGTDTFTFKYTQTGVPGGTGVPATGGSNGSGTGYDNGNGTPSGKGTGYDNQPARRYVGMPHPRRVTAVLIDSNGTAHPVNHFETTVRAGGPTMTSVQLPTNPPVRAESGHIEVRSPSGAPLARFQFSGGTLLNGNLRIQTLNLTPR